MLLRQRGDGRRVGDVQAQRDERLAGLDPQPLQGLLVDVGGDDPRAFADEGQRGGAADALSGRGDQGEFALQAHGGSGANGLVVGPMLS